VLWLMGMVPSPPLAAMNESEQSDRNAAEGLSQSRCAALCGSYLRTILYNDKIKTSPTGKSMIKMRNQAASEDEATASLGLYRY